MICSTLYRRIFKTSKVSGTELKQTKPHPDLRLKNKLQRSRSTKCHMSRTSKQTEPNCWELYFIDFIFRVFEVGLYFINNLS